MTGVSLKFTGMILSVMLLTLAAVFSQAALAQRPSRSFDSLRGLKKALEEANAPALTTQQEEQLKALIQAFRGSQPQGPSDELEAAYGAFGAAILAGNQAAANAQAAIIANLQAVAANARLQAEAKFKLDVIAVLRANGDQIGLLRQKFGDEGALRLLDSLSGGGFGGHGDGPRRF